MKKILQSNRRVAALPKIAFAVLALLCLRPTCVAGLDDFMKKAQTANGAKTFPSGLVYRSVQDGTGPHPDLKSIVVLDYSATSPKLGTFDDSYRRGRPLSIALSRATKCWQLGLVLMQPGGRAVLTCPAELAYGAAGTAKIPPNEPIQFEVHLLQILSAQD
jgi:FKBP-type peptidyl-prolyl cis-trans isomerase FkpA